jgi:superfamily II DNA or RNA helicase
MTREEVYNACLTGIEKSNFLLLEAATGLGKTAISLKLVNHLIATKYKGKQTSMLLLVAKTVHKQTWKDEINKWGGINVSSLTVECYESLKKHQGETFDIIVMDEVHHINSDARLEYLSTLGYGNIIGLSATIPKKLKQYLVYKYHAEIVSCPIVEAIESEVLPEPKIILMPLQLDNTKATETIEVNPKVKGKVYQGTFDKLWQYRRQKVHAIISCTQKQKLGDMNNQILFAKNRYQRTRQDFARNQWLFACGERIKYLANLKNDVVKRILGKLYRDRTITFCKTIEQAEYLGTHCIHSKNKDSDQLYKDFNDKKINHITSVNILNENANLVDCKYAVFANYSSSECVSMQRIGRSLRHKSPIIIMPYYEGTREQEILDEMLKDFNKESITTIHTLEELSIIINNKLL